MRSKRPKIVTLVTLGVLTLATLHLARFALGVSLPDLPLTVPAFYIPFTGALWGAGALLVGVALFSGRRWAPAAARWGGLAYALWFWTDRLLLVETDYARRTRPASLALTAVALVGLWWILRWPQVRTYFREMDE